MDRSLRWTLRIASAAGLVAIVVSHSLSAYLAKNENTSFSWLTTSQPVFLVKDAESQLTSSSGPASSSEMPGAGSVNDADAPDIKLNKVRALASAALLLEPLSARSLRILGQATKEPENTRRFMDAAIATSRLESGAAVWLINFYFEQKNYAETARLADVLLRSRPNMVEVFGALGRMAETDGKSEVQKLLAQRPPWRPAFFQHLEWGISDARTPLEMLLALQSDDAGPSSEEVQSYISLLMRNKLYDLAYYTWLLFLPEEQLSTTGLLANADFTFPLSGKAFDWDLKGAEGVRVGIEPEPDNPKKPGLHFSFVGGRVGDPTVSQKLTLIPGSYRMSGRQMGNVIGPRGVRWQVSCLDNPSSPPMALGPMLTGASQWAPYEFQINVPKVACPAQEVKLYLDARSASERIVSGQIWLDDLNIRRSSDR